MRNKTDDTVKSKENYISDAFSFVFPINFKAQSMCHNFISHVTCALVYKRYQLLICKVDCFSEISVHVILGTFPILVVCL